MRDDGFRASRQGNGKLPQAETSASRANHQIPNVSARKERTSDRAAAADQEPRCPNTKLALQLSPEVYPKFHPFRTPAAQNRLPPDGRRWEKSALSALVTWEGRWPQTSRPPDDG